MTQKEFLAAFAKIAKQYGFVRAGDCERFRGKIPLTGECCCPIAAVAHAAGLLHGINSLDYVASGAALGLRGHIAVNIADAADREVYFLDSKRKKSARVKLRRIIEKARIA